MEKVAIIGCGKTGRGWAMLFAAGGYKVCIYDNVPKQVHEGLLDMRSQLDKLKREGQLRGNLSVGEQMALIEGTYDLDSCVKGAFYIQECVFEDADLKRQVNNRVDKLMNKDAILASSTSYIVPAEITVNMTKKNRFIIAHPTNPPFYVPLVELVVDPTTDEDVLPKTKDLMKKIGQVPITVKKYIDGYVRNRIQNVIFKECFDLFQSGVMSATDIDLVMTEGLGRRYPFMGILETAYLNARGFVEYSKRYADVIHQVQSSLRPTPSFTDEEVLESIQDEMIKKTPLDKLTDRYKWRAARTAELTKLIKDLNEADARDSVFY